MRIKVKTQNIVYVEGINNEGLFWINNDLMVDEEKTARLLGCIENTLPVQEVNKALWYWKQAEFTNKDF